MFNFFSLLPYLVGILPIPPKLVSFCWSRTRIMFKPNINMMSETVKPKLSYQYHFSLGEDAALVDNQLQLVVSLAQAVTSVSWVELYHTNYRIAQSLRRVIQQSQLSTAFLQSTNVSAVITAGFRVMPYLLESSMNIGAGIF